MGLSFNSPEETSSMTLITAEAGGQKWAPIRKTDPKSDIFKCIDFRLIEFNIAVCRNFFLVNRYLVTDLVCHEYSRKKLAFISSYTDLLMFEVKRYLP